MTKEQTCVICERKFIGWGTNPAPIANKGVCCDECNAIYVIPARFSKLLEREETKNDTQRN